MEELEKDIEKEKQSSKYRYRMDHSHRTGGNILHGYCRWACSLRAVQLEHVRIEDKKDLASRYRPGIGQKNRGKKGIHSRE